MTTTLEAYDDTARQPTGVASVGFVPQSAPHLSCLVDTMNTPWVRDEWPLPTQPTVNAHAQFTTAEGDATGERVTFNVDHWFPGLTVRYAMRMKDGIQEHSLAFGGAN